MASSRSKRAVNPIGSWFCNANRFRKRTAFSCVCSCPIAMGAEVNAVSQTATAAKYFIRKAIFPPILFSKRLACGGQRSRRVAQHSHALALLRHVQLVPVQRQPQAGADIAADGIGSVENCARQIEEA